MNKNKPLLNAVETLNYSASLVEKFGSCKLSNGKTLAETLTVEGIPFWSIFAAEFAHSHIPKVLASDTSSESIVQRMRPNLARLKRRLRDLVLNRHNATGCTTWPAGKTFLCLGFTNQMYRDVLQPVVARLSMRNDCHVVALSDRDWSNMRLSSYADNCEYQTLWQHWDKQTKKQIIRLQKSISRTEVNRKLVEILPVILPDTERHILANFKDLFNRFFRAYLPLIVPQVVIARHILESHRPVMVISPDTADSRARIYTSLGSLMGIPCIDIQFGLAGDEGVEWRFLAADCVAAWGDASKKAILKQRIPEEKIILTGSPRHDCLVNLSEAEVRSKRAKLGVPENSVMIVLASTYELKTHAKYSSSEVMHAMKRAIFEAADKTPGVCLIVKPHPVENAAETQALSGKSRNVIFVEQHSDIRELIRVCDAFISFGSTATIDALIADKLTICPVFPGWVFSDIFKNSGATLIPDSAEEVMNIFKMVVNGYAVAAKARLEPARQDFLRHYVYRADGMAAARVETLALRMAGIAHNEYK